ncbi:hypothetical protein A3A45_00930 [Candidatus Daviesbacteria bacterium RIFCSPLOWO2_01_FULL_36_8]|nr:MAG: hypothetical protein A3A45_00930 [Candidatus Daviesbacteria bacterium RIFCSPLOWO2_01_FULL_36_8]
MRNESESIRSPEPPQEPIPKRPLVEAFALLATSYVGISIIASGHVVEGIGTLALTAGVWGILATKES